MAEIAAVVPAASDILCEACGYILSGLPETGNCPECGRPIAQSRGGHRRLSAFEAAPTVGSLVRTAASVMFRPGRFFRSLTTRPGDARAAAWFARCHRAVAAALFSVALCGLGMIDSRFAGWLRAAWSSSPPTPDDFRIDLYLFRFYWSDEPVIFGMMLAPAAVIIYGLIALTDRLAARLAAWIAAGRGIRLRPDVARRTLRFHAVHLVPVALLVAATVGGPLSLQLTPLALISYLVAAQVAARMTARGRARPPRTPQQPALGRIRFVTVALLMTVIVGWYFAMFDGPHFDRIAIEPADWRPLRYALAAEALLGLAYLLLSGWIAVRNTMYANDAPPAPRPGDGAGPAGVHAS
jgi:hypothetical protein